MIKKKNAKINIERRVLIIARPIKMPLEDTYAIITDNKTGICKVEERLREAEYAETLFVTFLKKHS